ncbi:MAG: diphosphomevalonate decarboxylase [Candidatus Thermoplasmatota archaeon]
MTREPVSVPTRTTKASAIAYPIQGLVKYHGLKDPVRRIPFHDSISVCTGPIHTHTTFEVLPEEAPAGKKAAVRRPSVEIDGKLTTGRAFDRVQVVVDAIREKAEDERSYRMVSRNDFPQYVGLGSSSSGFAALALAASAAYGWKASLEELSEVARLGAGSASRAVTGGVSEWVVEKDRSYSRQLLGPDDVDWRIVVPLVQHEEPTENVHAEVTSSPLFKARVDYIPSALAAMKKALATKDIRNIAPIGERDTLNLHAVTMTAESGHITWMPPTLEVIHTVRRLRKAGVPVWFSIDTGATAYLNTDAAHEQQVADAVKGIAGVSKVLHLRPAGQAHLVDEHLF